MDGDVLLAREWSMGALRATCFLQGSGRGEHGWRRVSCKGVVVGGHGWRRVSCKGVVVGGMDGDVFLAEIRDKR